MIKNFQITNELKKFISSSRWKKTEYINTHEYILESWGDKNIFSELCALIDKSGEGETFMGKQYKYFRIGEYKYWNMTISTGERIINRAKS